MKPAAAAPLFWQQFLCKIELHERSGILTLPSVTLFRWNADRCRPAFAVTSSLEILEMKMFKTKPVSTFIDKPADALRECLSGPMEITGGEQSFILMTAEQLRTMLADTYLADDLDAILQRLQAGSSVPEKKVMEILQS